MGKHLAIDMGSSNVKMLIGEIDQHHRIALREIHRFETPRVWFNEHISTDLHHVLDEVEFALKKLGAEGECIDSLGADSWSSDFGIVNPEGEPVGMPVFYRDYRTFGMPEQVAKVISYEKLYQLSTQRRMQDSTLCQLLALKKEKPQLLSGGNRILFLADMLMFYFSHRVVSEITLASYSQLFSMEQKKWEDKVFDLFDLPRTLQPEIVNPCDCLGTITDRAADWYKLNRFDVIAPAGHDTSCAVAAVPAHPGESWAFISTGSWFLVGMELEKPMNLELCYRYNCSNTGLAFGKTMLKRNVTAMWILQECMRVWRRCQPTLSYHEIQERARQSKPFCAMLDPDEIDFYNPENMPEAICRYLERTGQARIRPDDIGQITRLVDEGIVFKSAYAINCLYKISGTNPQVVYTVGGASAVKLINQMLADALDRKLVAGPTEATAIGNCLLQAVGCGELKGAAELREVVHDSVETRTYLPRDPEAWRKHYEAYIGFCGLPR